jgi:hypothetical protein
MTVSTMTRAVLSGRIVIGHTDPRWKLSSLEGNPPDNRRSFEDVVTFSDSFPSKPDVFVALSYIDATPGPPGDPNVNNVRLSVEVVPDPDRDGFRYRISTWSASRVWGAGISWIAIAA